MQRSSSLILDWPNMSIKMTRMMLTTMQSRPYAGLLPTWLQKLLTTGHMESKQTYGHVE